MKKPKLNQIVAGSLAGAAVFLQPSQGLTRYHTLSDQTHFVQMSDMTGPTKRQHIGVAAGLDKENNSIDINYELYVPSKENCSKQGAYKLFRLNHTFSRLFIIHPKEVKISKINQKARLTPPCEMEELKPLEETPKAQWMLKGGEYLLEKALKKSKIPFAKKIFDKFIKYSIEKENKTLQKTFDKINKNYTVTRIPSFPVTKIIKMSNSQLKEFQRHKRREKTTQEKDVKKFIKEHYNPFNFRYLMSIL